MKFPGITSSLAKQKNQIFYRSIMLLQAINLKLFLYLSYEIIAVVNIKLSFLSNIIYEIVEVSQPCGLRQAKQTRALCETSYTKRIRSLLETSHPSGLLWVKSNQTNISVPGSYYSKRVQVLSL